MRRQLQLGLAVAAVVSALSGCCGVKDYLDRGFRVGPDYCKPEAAVAPHWIDEADIRVRQGSDEMWWTVFKDPVLNDLVHEAYRQNLTLKQAGSRILEARAQLCFAKGNLFPQQQTADGGYKRVGIAGAPGGLGASFLNQWNYGFNLSWELDFWGRYRRAIEAADDLLSASVEDYDDVLVTLLGDVASNYVQVRMLQQEIDLATENVKLQKKVKAIAQAKFDAGAVTDLDVQQAETTLKQTEAQIPVFRNLQRQALNQLCILMAIPPQRLEERLGLGKIPEPPVEIAIGIPADLICRRPDIRRAERQAAAQCQQIGIAKADFYPQIRIDGSLGYSAQEFKDLFRSSAFNGSVGPTFQWKILNYGRLSANVKFQEATFQEYVLRYLNTVLQANAEAENGLSTFLQAKKRAKLLDDSVVAAEKATVIVLAQYDAGKVDFNRVATLLQTLVQLEDLQTQSHGQISQGLVQVYRAVGGGWQIRLEDCGTTPAGEAPPLEPAPTPTPTPKSPAHVPGLLDEIPDPKSTVDEAPTKPPAKTPPK